MHPTVVLLSLLFPGVYSSLGACLSSLLQLPVHSFTLFPTSPHDHMALYSGKWLNDLGDYTSCSHLSIARYALLFLRYEGPFLGVGLCGPTECTVEDYLHIIGNVTDRTLHVPPLALFLSTAMATYHKSYGKTRLRSDVPVDIVFPKDRETTELSSGAVWMLAVCGAVGVLVTVGTGLDAFHSGQQPVKRDPGVYELMDYSGKPGDDPGTTVFGTAPVRTSPAIALILCFSLFRTVPGLTKVPQRSGGLGALDGVRVLSILSIIMGHLLLVRVMGSVSKNPLGILTYMKEARAAPLYSAHFAVDTFFWLSGFLMALGLVPKLGTAAQPHIWQVYLHRFLRICPLFMFVLFLTWVISPYIGAGPRGYHIDDVNEHCAQYWWTGLFFLHHQIPDWLGIGCLGQSWYLGTDMQLFLVLVPVLYLYSYRRDWGWGCFAGLCVVAVVTSGFVTWKYQFSVMAKSVENVQNHYSSRYYVQPYCRCAPYVLGVTCAILYLTHSSLQSSNPDPLALRLLSPLSSPRTRVLCQFSAVVLSLFLVFIQCDAYQAIDDPGVAWSRGANTLYISVHRLLWGVCLSLLLLPTLVGLHPLVQRVLSLPVWAPLSKLTFCVYLLHVHIIVACALSQEAAVWFGDLSLYSDFCFVTVLSFALSVPLHLCVEAPLNGVYRTLKV